MKAERERFSRLGFFDTTFGIRVHSPDRAQPAEFALTFEVFECVRVLEGSAGVETDRVTKIWIYACSTCRFLCSRPLAWGWL